MWHERRDPRGGSDAASDPGPAAASEDWVQRGLAGTRVLLLRGLALRAIGLVSSLALVALVTPADLGLFATVRGAIGLIQFAAELGFDLALIRRPEDPPRAQLAALTGQRTLVFLLIFAGAALLPGASTLFGLLPAEYGWLMLLTIGSLVLTPVGGTSRIVMERKLEFGRLSMVEIQVVLIQNLGLVLFALGGDFREGLFLVQAGSLVYGAVALRWMQAVPAPSFDFKPLRSLWSDSLGFASNGLLGRLFESFTPILVARLFGLDVAGLWHFASRVGQFLQVLLDAYSRAGIAVAARLVKEVTLLRGFSTDILRAAAALLYPAAGLLFAALPLVGVWFPRWSEGVRMAQVYVIALGLLGAIRVALWPVAVARSGSRIALSTSVLSLVVVWGGLLLLSALGSENVALPFAAEMAGSVALLIWVLPPTVRPSLARHVWPALLPVAVCAALVAVGEFRGWPAFLTAAVASVPCGLLLLGAVVKTWAVPATELYAVPESQ